MGGRNNWKISTSFFPFLFFFLSLFFTRDQFPPSDIYFKIHGHNVLICSTLYTYTYLVVRNNVFPTYLNLVIPRPFRGLPHCLVATRKHAVIVLAWLVSHNHPDERSIERRSREREYRRQFVHRGAYRARIPGTREEQGSEKGVERGLHP